MTPARPIKVLYFAALRERMGTPFEELDLPEEVHDVRDLARFLERSRSRLTGVLGSVRFAVGDEFVGPERVLQAGDVVALIPPVSGS